MHDHYSTYQDIYEASNTQTIMIKTVTKIDNYNVKVIVQSHKVIIIVHKKHYFNAKFFAVTRLLIGLLMVLVIRRRQLNFLLYSHSGELFRVGRSAKQ